MMGRVSLYRPTGWERESRTYIESYSASSTGAGLLRVITRVLVCWSTEIIFSVDDTFSFSGLDEYNDSCRYFLFDTRTPSVGGSGRKFNWEILKKYTMAKSFFLSGGIGPDDAEETAGLKHLNIHALDINSRFENRPGNKNIDLLKNFIEKIRADS